MCPRDDAWDAGWTVADHPWPRMRLVTGRITPGEPLVVSSEMPDGGFIFSDGVVERALEWNAGATVTVTVGDRYVQRIVR